MGNADREFNRQILDPRRPKLRSQVYYLTDFHGTLLTNLRSDENTQPASPVVAHGSKEVPDGVPATLAGLSFVFTGELSSFSRKEAIDLLWRVRHKFFS